VLEELIAASEWKLLLLRDMNKEWNYVERNIDESLLIVAYLD